ncbi:tRNA pseudouridine synthase D [Methylogaea oryzae]|uniref:tRNA pseudouridine synthase D n=1 Tax=Methylogaea oryzae TaxID=1295382 RepID=A0A8D5AM72_9GAMM|nr:tRNA pseudouridine synthase D [Methylogaea oryzae]
MPEEFQVEEVLGFEPEGQGEHVMLWVEKRGENTEWVAKQLARFANVPPRSVGYAGLKDRHAVTRQWFTVQLPGKADPDWQAFNSDSVRVLRAERHRRKLPKGALTGNRFRLGVRLGEVDEDVLLERLKQVASQGVPNYFGEQRFGRDGDNVEAARRWFAGDGPRPERHLTGLYLSAVRSFLFNEILARRVADGTWNQGLPGDVFMFGRGHSFFAAPELTPDIVERLASGEIHPSGPLWGKGESPAAGAALALEQTIAAQHADLCDGLLTHDVEMGRRPYRLMAERLGWEREGDTLWLEFFLPAGAYATTVVREILACE